MQLMWARGVIHICSRFVWHYLILSLLRSNARIQHRQKTMLFTQWLSFWAITWSLTIIEFSKFFHNIASANWNSFVHSTPAYDVSLCVGCTHKRQQVELHSQNVPLNERKQNRIKKILTKNKFKNAKSAENVFVSVFSMWEPLRWLMGKLQHHKRSQHTSDCTPLGSYGFLCNLHLSRNRLNAAVGRAAFLFWV